MQGLVDAAKNKGKYRHTSHHLHVFLKGHPKEQNNKDVRYRNHINDARYGHHCIKEKKMQTAPVIIGTFSEKLIPKSKMTRVLETEIKTTM